MKLKIIPVVLLLFLCGLCSAQTGPVEKRLHLEKRISDYQVNPSFRDDTYGLLVVKSALQSIKEGSGGIGACLVDSTTGSVVETGSSVKLTVHRNSSRLHWTCSIFPTGILQKTASRQISDCIENKL